LISRSGGFLDLASFDASSANHDAFYGSLADGFHPFQVRVESSFSQVVGVAHMMAYQRLFAAYFANS
jgi:hypothetical protein